MSYLGVDAEFNGQIIRKDFPNIIACKRELCMFLGARLLYQSSGYVAGTVLARNSSTGIYEPYVNGGASGTGTACAILPFDLLDAPSGVNVLKQVLVKGQVYQAKLTGLDSGAISNLVAKSVTDVAGDQILIF